MREEVELTNTSASRPQTEEAFRPFALFDIFPDKVFMINPQGVILECNAVFAAYMSRSPEDCLGLDVFEFIAKELGLPDVADIRRKKAEEVFRTGCRLIFDDEHDSRVFRSTVYPVPSPEGTITKLLIIEQDITENRRAEKEAEHGWLFIQAIIDATPGTFCLLDTKGRILALNPYLCEQIVGKLPGEMTGANSMELVHAEDRKKLGHSMKNVLERGSEESAEVRILIRGGPEFRWFLLKSRRIVIEQNHMLIVIGTDIQDRKQAEQALALSEQKFRSITEQLDGMVFILDSSGIITYISPASERISGFKPDEMTGHSFTGFIHFEDRQQAAERFFDMLTKDDASGKRESVVRCRRKNGSCFWGEIKMKLYQGEGFCGMIGLLFDITTRMRHESLRAFRFRVLQLTESHSMEELLRVIVDEAEKNTESRIGFFHCLGDESGPDSLQVASTSVRTNMKWGGESDDPHPSLLDAHFWVDALKVGGPVINNSFRQSPDPGNAWPDGHPDIIRTLVVPILQRDRIVALIGVGKKPEDYDEDDVQWVTSLGDIAWDIVARKFAEQSKHEMQALLIQSQKMELIGQLAGGIAHDFNNMLGVILGNIEMALTLHPLSGMMQKNLMNILSAVNRSSDLTTQLLAFAREQAVMPIVVELNIMVENLLVMLRRIIGENITIVWIPDSHRSLIRVDPAQIDQILVNLCVNARNAITGTGTITIETGCWQCLKKSDVPFQSSKIPGDYITLTVTDTGCGIDREHLPHIFEPFFTINKQGKGVGLGLATVYGIVRQNNGYIDCQSEPGKGTTFIIHFPRHSGSYFGPDLQEEPSVREADEKVTVLLVEDEPDILNLCKLELEKNGYTVLSASTPFEALSIAANFPDRIALLLTDVVMPQMNGCDLAKKLLLDIPHLKTLFMSGYTPEVIDYPDMFDRKTNYIQKPFTLKALVTAVRKLLNSGA
ncbi:MAG: PAS domain S-box protein [Chlorobiaceae bacterium]|nr:PAS domain S-box protein [Chlorobiaceae bacterium]NTV60460.1 PAS domain S-box protein [Chlorobiaceae bacterium]